MRLLTSHPTFDVASAPILIAFGLAVIVAIAVVGGLAALAIVLIVRAHKRKKAVASAPQHQ